MIDQEVDITERLAHSPATAKAVVIMLLVALFAYYNSLHGAYVLDDGRYLADPNIDKPLRAEMATRPLFMASLTLNHRLDGFHPRGYHLFNLTIHLLAAFTLFDLIRRTLLLPRFESRFDGSAGWIALAISTIWLAHPLNTQAVTYMVQRCESMMGLFFLLAMWCLLRGATGTRRFWWYSGGVLSCAAAAGCKEVIAMYPPIALLYDRLFLSGSWRAALKARGWYYAIACLPSIAPVAALSIIGFFTDKIGTVGFGVRLYTPYTYACTQTEVILYYIQMSFWPKNQCLDYIDWPVRHSIAECLPSAIAIVSMLLVVGYGVIRNRLWAFPAAWFFLILAPTSSILPIQDALFEHRMYLPLIGIITLVVGGGVLLIDIVEKYIPGSRLASHPAAGAAVVCMVTALAFLTVVRNEDYGSERKMYADNVAKRPGNPRARHNLAMSLFASGDLQAANEHLDVILKVNLQIPALRVDQIRVLREFGRTSEAVTLAKQLYADTPDAEGVSYELAVSLMVDGHVTEALPFFEKTVASDPNNRTGRTHYGIALRMLGRDADAEREFRVAAELDPGYAAQLIQVARKTALNPESKQCAVRLVVWYADAACRMRGEPSAEYLDTYGICLARAGMFQDAAVQASRAAELARKRGDEYLGDRIEARAALFRAGRKYPSD